MTTYATQQRSVIITAIVLAIILGGALVWLLNRTPADQLTTQSPPEETATAMPVQEPAVALTQATTTPVVTATPEASSVQGVAATAPTGASTLGMGLVSLLSGLGGLGVISLALFGRLGR